MRIRFRSVCRCVFSAVFGVGIPSCSIPVVAAAVDAVGAAAGGVGAADAGAAAVAGTGGIVVSRRPGSSGGTSGWKAPKRCRKDGRPRRSLYCAGIYRPGCAVGRIAAVPVTMSAWDWDWGWMRLAAGAGFRVRGCGGQVVWVVMVGGGFDDRWSEFGFVHGDFGRTGCVLLLLVAVAVAVRLASGGFGF